MLKTHSSYIEFIQLFPRSQCQARSIPPSNPGIQALSSALLLRIYQKASLEL